MSEIYVYCEKCGKKILEKDAQCIATKSNHLILCNDCYKGIKEGKGE